MKEHVWNRFTLVYNKENDITHKLNVTFNVSSGMKVATVNQHAVEFEFLFLQFRNFPKLWHLVLRILFF